MGWARLDDQQGPPVSVSILRLQAFLEPGYWGWCSGSQACLASTLSTELFRQLLLCPEHSVHPPGGGMCYTSSLELQKKTPGL